MNASIQSETDWDPADRPSRLRCGIPDSWPERDERRCLRCRALPPASHSSAWRVRISRSVSVVCSGMKRGISVPATPFRAVVKNRASLRPAKSNAVRSGPTRGHQVRDSRHTEHDRATRLFGRHRCSFERIACSLLWRAIPVPKSQSTPRKPSTARGPPTKLVRFLRARRVMFTDYNTSGSVSGDRPVITTSAQRTTRVRSKTGRHRRPRISVRSRQLTSAGPRPGIQSRHLDGDRRALRGRRDQLRADE